MFLSDTYWDTAFWINCNYISNRIITFLTIFSDLSTHRILKKKQTNKTKQNIINHKHMCHVIYKQLSPSLILSPRKVGERKEKKRKKEKEKIRK